MTSKLDTDLFAVVAGHQTAGKGTRGRTWVSGSGNLFLTIVIRRSSIPTPLMLIPLRYQSTMNEMCPDLIGNPIKRSLSCVPSIFLTVL